MKHFCTLFNSAYQFHAHLLYKSLCKNEGEDNFLIFFFCFDNDSINYFQSLNFKNVKVVSLGELESHLPELKKAKTTRSAAEYFFTSTPAICKYVFEKFDEVDQLVYLDADLFFFSSTNGLFEEIGSASVSIIPHRFNKLNYVRNIYGYYNVGWISFKNDQIGIKCLNKWYNDNLKWCYDKLRFKKYADQKYLNYWKKDFENIHIVKNIGANLAPWNVGNYKIRLIDNCVFVNNTQLVFYHYASLKYIDGAFYTTVSSYFSFLDANTRDLIYQPYIRSLVELGFKPYISIRLNKRKIVIQLRKLIRAIFRDRIAY